MEEARAGILEWIETETEHGGIELFESHEHIDSSITMNRCTGVFGCLEHSLVLSNNERILEGEEESVCSI